jgi:trafficking protein particle complex subunit 5
VSLSAFSFLFSEIVQYCQSRVTQVNELEQKLSDIGFDMGHRMLELMVYRDKKYQRETKVEAMLHFINNVIWKNLFGKQADSLQKSSQKENQCMFFVMRP